MNPYTRHCFPWLCDLLLGQPLIGRYRKALLAGCAGEVLEIGFGTGLNLPHYPKDLRRLTTVDPNPGMNRLARRRIRRNHIVVDQRQLSGERLPFADSSFDWVVSTFTLCSIANVTTALQEVHRVLRPEGGFLFLEHGLSRDPDVQRWQHRLNGLEMWLADGCHLDRDIRALVAEVPFRWVEAEEFLAPGMPRTHGSLTRGLARK